MLLNNLTERLPSHTIIYLKTKHLRLFTTLFFFMLACFTFPTHSAHAQEPSDESGVSPQVISLPSGPGSLEGIGESFEPDLSTGTSRYMVKFQSMPGRVGFQPELAIDYNSGNPTGPWGLGWKLNVPYIQRQTDEGLPSYDDSLDGFIYSSGEKLVALDNGEFRFENEGQFMRFRRLADGGWEVHQPNGVRLLFGESENGRESHAYGTFRWRLERQIDRHGNEIDYLYTHDAGYAYLSEIRYNESTDERYNAILLHYELRSDVFTDRTSRAPISIAWRVHEMEMWALGRLVRVYRFGYLSERSTGTHSLLQSVTEVGDDGISSLPPTTFTYTEFDAAAYEVSSLENPPTFSLLDDDAELVDINYDGLPDLFHTPNEGHEFHINRGEEQLQLEVESATHSPAEQLSHPGVRMIDLLGNGQVELMVKANGRSSESSACYYYARQKGSKWEQEDRVPFGICPNVDLDDPNLRWLDINHDKRVDVMLSTSSHYFIWLAQEDDSWSENADIVIPTLAVGTPLVFSDPHVKLSDMTGDRLLDIVYVRDGLVAYFPHNGMGDFGEMVTMANPPQGLGSWDSAVQLDDINNDGLSDLVLAQNRNVYFWLNLGNDSFMAQQVLTGTPYYTPSDTALRLADIDGDGASELLYSRYPAPEDEVMQVVDFSTGSQPHLISSIDNGLGRTIEIEYKSSTVDYIQDWNEGDPWQETLPFPVQVVSRVHVQDALTNEDYITEYAYRDGYYDGVQKEFRGFQQVDKIEPGDDTAATTITRYLYDLGFEDESRKGMVLEMAILGEDGQCNGLLSPSTPRTTPSPPAPLPQGEGSRMPSPPAPLPQGSSGGEESSPLPGGEGLGVRGGRWAGQGLRECYRHEINQLTTRVLHDTNSGQQISHSFVSQTDAYLYENQETPIQLRQFWALDEYGNTIQEFNYGQVCGEEVTCGNDEILQYTSYAINLDAWILNTPSVITQTDGLGNIVSQKRLYYDGEPYVGLPLGQVLKGDLTRQEENLGPRPSSVPPSASGRAGEGERGRVGEESRFIPTQRQAFDEYGNAIGIMDANDNLTTVEYDALVHTFPVVERLHLDSEGQGQSLTMVASYDFGFGKINAATDFSGHPHVYAYDTFGRISKIALPGDTLALPTQQFTYTLGSPLNSIITAERERSGESEVRQSVTYFDGLGRKLQVRSEAENGQFVVNEALTFNARQGEKEKFQPYFDDTFAYTPPDATLPHTTSHYDPMGRVIRLDNPDNSFTSLVYRPLSQVQYDEEDNRPDSSHFETPKTLVYDGLERLVSVEEQNKVDGQLEVYTTTYSYDPLGNLTQITDAEENMTSVQYDALSRKLYMDNPDRGETFYEYDDGGNLLELTDAKGQIIRYAYDAANRPLSEQWVLSDTTLYPALIYHYDTDLSPQHPDAENTLGQLTYIEEQAGASYFSYDTRGNIIASIRNFAEENLDFVTRMSYDGMDRLTELTYPDGLTVTLAYNELGLLEALPNFIDDINYTASAQRETISYSNGVTSNYSYDNRLRMRLLQSLVTSTSSAQALTQEGTNGQAAALQELSYTFDSSSNIVSITDNRSTRTDENDLTQSYSYDNLYRLTNATGSYGQIDYTYDSIGNMIHKSSTAADARLNLGEMRYGENGAGPHALTFADGDTYTYDANGNQTAKANTNHTWDHRNQLTSVSGPTLGQALSTYTYDAEGQRTRQTVTSGDVTTTTLYIGKYAEVRNNQLVQYIFDDTGRIAQVTTPFDPENLIEGFTDDDQRRGVPLRSPPTDDAKGQAQGIAPTAETLWYLSDHLGGTSLMVDQNGDVTSEVIYYPYGLTRYEMNGGEVRYRFTGKELDATGLHYYEARYYDAMTGRFISVDPLYAEKPEKGLEDPQKLNLYAYAGNNPLKYTDPTGLGWLDIIQAGLDIIGMIPFVGEVADMANAAIYTARGDYANAALSASAAIPFVGNAATGAKWVNKGIKSTDTVSNAAKTFNKTLDTASPTKGQKVYRVYGEKNNPLGESWTPIDPSSVKNYRDAAGLPDVNTGRFIIEGRIVDPQGVKEIRNALSLDGNKGGLPEYIIPNADQTIKIKNVSGVNPQY